MNSRFSDYVTSGAFSLSLTRNQISLLSMAVGGGIGATAATAAALERKGLIAPLAGPNHGLRDECASEEWRVNAAGILVVSLLAEAGLVNGGEDAAAREVDALRAELDAARRSAAESGARAWSALSRLKQAEQEIDELRACAKTVQLREHCERRGIRLKRDRLITPRDPMPEVPTEELERRVKKQREGEG